MMPAKKIIGYTSPMDEAFISFEDARYIDRIRIFMNTTLNMHPVYFFLKLPEAVVLAHDMLDMKAISYKKAASGMRRGGTEPTYRELNILTEPGGYRFEISNYIGTRSDGGRIVRNTLDTGELVSVYVPHEEARNIGAAIIMTSMAPVPGGYVEDSPSEL